MPDQKFTRWSDMLDTLTEGAAAAHAVKQFRDSSMAPQQDSPDRSQFRGELIIQLHSDSGEEGETRLGDVLTDLIHWAHEADVDVSVALERAVWMVEQERSEWGLSKLAAVL